MALPQLFLRHISSRTLSDIVFDLSRSLTLRSLAVMFFFYWYLLTGAQYFDLFRGRGDGHQFEPVRLPQVRIRKCRLEDIRAGITQKTLYNH